MGKVTGGLALSPVQKAVLVVLQREPIEQQRIQSPGDLLIGGETFSWQTLQALENKGLVLRVKANKAEGRRAHYALTDDGARAAESLPADTKRPQRKSWKELQIERSGGLLPAKESLAAIGSPLKSATLFDLMRAYGFMEDRKRLSSNGVDTRLFAALTPKGERYGANIPGFHPDETEMVFHIEKFRKLLADLGAEIQADMCAVI
jgi:DNA-binding PadR family transcriptional regulator